MRHVLQLMVTGFVAWYLLNQVRRPSRWLGRIFIRGMNRRHSAVTDWSLGHVEIGDQREILGVGCGGARTIAKLAQLAPEARVIGIDFAAGSVAEARSHTANLITAERVGIAQASVAALPLADASFDLVTAVETHYYWPGLVSCFAEVRRVLRPGGQFVLIAEVYATPATGWLLRLAMAPMRAAVLTADQHRELLVRAGYEGVEVETDRRGWICAAARAP